MTDNPYVNPSQPEGVPSYAGSSGGAYSNASITEEDKTISALAHIGGIILSWVIPLVVFFVYPPTKSKFINDNAKEALNFQITLFVGYSISAILMFVLIGFLTWGIIFVVSIYAGVKATLASSRGEYYRYPFAIRLIK